MFGGRSPPLERSQSLNTVSNISDVSKINSKRVDKQGEENVSSPLINNNNINKLTWRDECITPTSEINKHHIAKTTIASPATTTTTASSVTTTTITTTSTTSCSAMATTSVNNYPIFSTLHTTNTMLSHTGLPDAPIHVPQTNPTISPVNPHIEVTQNQINASSAKRSRLSPAGPNGAGISKKVKTKNTQPQKTLASYWLSQPPQSSNRFSVLSNDDEQETASNKNTDTSISKKHVKVPSRKPPPIYIQGVQMISKLIKALNDLPNCKYELKVLKDNEVKVQPAESIHYTAIIKMLKDKNTQYYTYKPKEQRGFRVFLRNVHYSADTEEIKQLLSAYGHEVIHIQNVLQLRTKKPLSLFALELKVKDNNKDIYNIDTLMHCKIAFEPPRQKRSIPQCTNCQKYGHTKNFCTRNPICVKCAGDHKTFDCPIKQKSEHIKCALCGENHTASYKGCSVYKELKVNMFPSLRNKEIENTNKEQRQQKPTSTQVETASNRSEVIPSLSYAQATTSNQSKPSQTKQARNTNISPVDPRCSTTNTTSTQNTKLEPQVTQHNDMQDLKDMMKQLLSQVSNMMNIITALLTKLNG